MDNRSLLKQLFDGSNAQRKSFNKEGLTKRLKKKIGEGNNNSIGTLKIRLFILQFQNRDLWLQLCPMIHLMEDFNEAIESTDTKRIKDIIKQYESRIKKLTKLLKDQPLREVSYITHCIFILTLTIALFKEIKPIKYSKIFSKKNRYSPLNPFFPFKL